MKDDNELRIRLNAYNEVDVDFYIARAHEMRSQAFATAFRSFKAWLIERMDRSWFPDKANEAPRRRIIQSDWPWVDLILQSAPDRTRHA